MCPSAASPLNLRPCRHLPFPAVGEGNPSLSLSHTNTNTHTHKHPLSNPKCHPNKDSLSRPVSGCRSPIWQWLSGQVLPLSLHERAICLPCPPPHSLPGCQALNPPKDHLRLTAEKVSRKIKPPTVSNCPGLQPDWSLWNNKIKYFPKGSDARKVGTIEAHQLLWRLRTHLLPFLWLLLYILHLRKSPKHAQGKLAFQLKAKGTA